MKFFKSIAILSFFMMLVSCDGASNEDVKSIQLYCASGIKGPVSEIAKLYYEKYNVRVDIQYGGSGTLLSNLQIAKRGDLYLAADDSYLEIAKKKNLVAETQPLAQMLPVLIIKKGNPKKIKGIEDLTNKRIRVSLGSPGATAVGQLFKEVCEKKGLWDAIEANAKVFKPTVNDIVTDVHIGAVDVCVGWDATAKQYDDLDIIQLNTDENITRTIEVGVLNYSEKATEALKFLRFMSSPEFGNPLFEKHRFTPIKGDAWAETPKVTLLSGGVNRIGLEPSIQRFEKREGVEIIRVYNGCGVLVSQIRAGTELDAYLTCDTSYMTQVDSLFKDINTLTQTKIIIITQKGNPKNIKGLADLTKSGLKVGVTNPKMSALGYLVDKMLTEKGLRDEIFKNVRSQTPTADLLVNQLRTGSLDAAIVYIANVTKVKDKVDVVDIDGPGNIAIQNYGVVKNSSNSWLMKRLLDELYADESIESFNDNGMIFIGDRN